MAEIKIQYLETGIGPLVMGAYEGKLCLLDYRDRKLRGTVARRLARGLGAEFVERDEDLFQEARGQLGQYLAGQRVEFSLPILLVGSAFQQQVWQALTQVPYGKTASYLDIAKAIDNEKAVRAVAGACGANSLALLIPCHRIIGSDGRLGGYGGGVELKKRLLALEQGGLTGG
ncbi:MAG: methylated-DNA--[protein]-cysteine S-methyltransferase [Thermodesulfobacteriota bacterium]